MAHRMTDSNQHPMPLQGVRVLDLTRVLAGPYCTMILADLGAEVVKVERYETGDDARQFGPFLPDGNSAYFASINRGKKSITLDLKDESDQEKFCRLVEQADVLVENFRPGSMARLDLSANRLQQLNPRLIYASLSGFGHVGLETERAAYDIVIQALSGLMSITGESADHPVRVGTSISDILTGIFGAVSVVSALRHRDQTGHGTIVDLAMLDCAVATLENALARYSVSGHAPQPLGTRHPSITPFQAFDTSDGSIVVAAGNDALWQKLCNVLGCGPLAGDPRFATNQDRTQNCQDLENELTLRFKTQSQEHWLGHLATAGVPAAPIRNVEQVATDPHLASRGMLHSMRDNEGEPFLTAGSPLRMNGHPPVLADRAPELGEHTNLVFQEWLNDQ